MLMMTWLMLGFSLWAGEPAAPPAGIARFFEPPAEFAGDMGDYRSPLAFADGRRVANKEQWGLRRAELLKSWREILGTPPALFEHPKTVVVETVHMGTFTREKLRVTLAADRTDDAYILTPDGPGPFPAVLVTYYEATTAVGLNKQPHRDFALRLAERGFVTMAVGFDPRVINADDKNIRIQPLSYLAYVASNAYNVLASRPKVDPQRIGVMGHSYGGKWAMFAACLDERFACGVWSDPGIVFDEKRPNVNYWEPWYLGWTPGGPKKRGVPTPTNPRAGAYDRLVKEGRDLLELQALMAPRPFLVSGGAEDNPERWRALNHLVALNALLGASHRVAMTNRQGHDPTELSNEQIYQFLEYVLKTQGRTPG